MTDSPLGPIPIDEVGRGGANAPVFEVGADLSEFKGEFGPGASRFRRYLTEEIPLDALLIDRGSDTLVVSFHGATNRATTDLPRFERLRTLLEFPDVSLLLISDPTLHLDPKIWLTWYTGWGEIDGHAIIADWIQQFAAKLGVERLILSGSSGGGFAAIQVSALIPGSIALAFNAQTAIAAYRVEGTYYSVQRDYVRVVWPDIWKTFASPNDIEDSSWADAADERVSCLVRYSVPRDNLVYLVQNIEEYHYQDHFLPFLEAAWAGGNHNNIIPWVNRQGTEHVVPSTIFFKDRLKAVIDTAWVKLPAAQ